MKKNESSKSNTRSNIKSSTSLLQLINENEYLEPFVIDKSDNILTHQTNTNNLNPIQNLTSEKLEKTLSDNTIQNLKPEKVFEISSIKNKNRCFNYTEGYLISKIGGFPSYYLIGVTSFQSLKFIDVLV